jgi:type I restriction enzyme R subunit
MQAIARANRVHEGKNNGLIVDYCGILKNLRKALATFAGHQGGSLIDGDTPQPEVDPVKPEEELLADLVETIALVRGFLEERGFRLDDIIERTGFARNRAIIDAKEAVNENDESRKRFEILAREVFKKFRACLTVKGVNDYRRQYDAINIIYTSLQADREKADITTIIRELHAVVDAAVEPKTAEAGPESSITYDISRIDFDRLRKEFERSRAKNTTVQNLKEAVEKRLRRMIQQNPLRTNFQKHYEEIIEAYNREKDRVTIEKTFEELLRFVEALDTESRRVLREGLDEETLALFDLLMKPDISKKDIERLKQVASELLAKLKAERLRADNWWEKQATRDAIKVEIRDFLWSEETGLPVECYSDQEVDAKAEQVYLHIFNVYTSPSSSAFVH